MCFADCRLNKRGGGVLMLVKSNLKPSLCSTGSERNLVCNVVSVQIGVSNEKYAISTVYRPPNTSTVDSDKLIDYLTYLNESTTNLILTGDFNYPHICWSNSALTKCDGISDFFQSSMDELGLYHCVDFATCGSNTLDLILVSCPHDILECSLHPPISSSDHSSVFVSINMEISCGVSSSHSVNIPAAKKLDLQAAAQLLGEINWRNIFANCRHVDEYVSNFMHALRNVITLCTKAKSVRRNNPKKIIPRHIRHLILKKRRLWRHASDNVSREAYKKCCKDVRRAMRYYVSKCELDLVNNPDNRNFYKYENKALGRINHTVQLSDSKGNIITDESTLAETFNTEFIKNFSSRHDVQFPSRDGISFNVSPQDTYKALLASTNSAAGPDGINGSFLRQLAPVLCLPLSIIFQQSVEQAIFPTNWKSAIVIPIYKGKGSKLDPASYRPISLCSTIGKALERIVRDDLLRCINVNHPLNDSQHGFTVNKSTITNLLVTEKTIAESNNCNEPLDVINFDFSRAFDRVLHHKLLHLLSLYGLSDKMIAWMHSFLSDRTQAVRVGALSSTQIVTSGVTQGSVLGPTLFSIFLDSLLSKLDIPSAAYADDFKFVANLSTYSPERIQRNVNCVHDWSIEMEMPLSEAKCSVVHYGSLNPGHQYHCGSTTIGQVDTFKDLGVTRNSDCSYHEHVANIAQKSRRLVGLCYRGLASRNADFLRRVYTTYILPVLSYASLIWCPAQRHDIHMLESVQRRFSKRLSGQRNATYEQRLHNLQMLSLESSRFEADMITVFKLLHGLIGISPNDVGLTLCTNNTRAGGLRLQQQHIRTYATANLFMFRAAREWNCLPLNVVSSATLTVFKNRQHSWLMDTNI